MFFCLEVDAIQNHVNSLRQKESPGQKAGAVCCMKDRGEASGLNLQDLSLSLCGACKHLIELADGRRKRHSPYQASLNGVKEDRKGALGERLQSRDTSRPRATTASKPRSNITKKYSEHKSRKFTGTGRMTGFLDPPASVSNGGGGNF